MVGGGDSVYLKCWVNAHFQLIFARCASAVTPRKKFLLTLMHYALSNEHTMNTVRCPRSKRGSKTQNDRFPCKIALHLKKDRCKVSLCENSDKTVRHSFVSPIYPCITDWWRSSASTRKVGGYWPPCKTPIFNLFSLAAPQP